MSSQKASLLAYMYPHEGEYMDASRGLAKAQYSMILCNPQAMLHIKLEVEGVVYINNSSCPSYSERVSCYF